VVGRENQEQAKATRGTHVPSNAKRRTRGVAQYEERPQKESKAGKPSRSILSHATAWADQVIHLRI
jgi:hypothetical protein